MPAARSLSFLRVVALCWKRPRLLLIELGWRWLCGAFLLTLVGYEAQRIALATAPAIAATGLMNATLESAIADPAPLALSLANTLNILRPWLLGVTAWLAPVALLAWVAAFSVGRAALLRQWDTRLARRPWLLGASEAVRLAALAAGGWGWWRLLQWAAAIALGPAVDAPGAGAQADPNLVLYCALVIMITIGLFALWSAVSWVLVAAPLFALLEGTSWQRGLLRSITMPRTRGQLLEVNLAMAVIKLGLVVLAIVLSATPLPFEAIMQGWPLTGWWVLVTLLYLAASDFFKMARFLAFVEQLRARYPRGNPDRRDLD